jgi:transketolase
VLPPSVTARVAVEAGVAFGWERWIGSGGAMVGMTAYGASAPAEQLYRHFGITTAAVVSAAKGQVG